MKSITLLHPFSPNAIGLSKEDVLFSHSNPHSLAFKHLQNQGYSVWVDYFDTTLLPHSKISDGLKKRFWPVTNYILKSKNRWRKEESLWHLGYFYFFPTDLTIINMSGNLSHYTYRFANLLQNLGKPYIAMIGGLHVSNEPKDMEYYKKAHHIIVHTAIQKKTLKNTLGFENLDIVVMPLGVDTTIFKPENKPYIEVIELLYVGRISRLKQIEIAIKSVSFCIKKGVNKIHMNIIGPISDLIYFEELKQLVKSLKLETFVTFKGSVAHYELVPYYQNAHLLLLPSAHESFGMVIIEAMACGTPVIGLKGSGGPEEIIVNDLNGVLCNEIDFSEKVFANIDIDKQEKLSIRSRKDVIEKWSIEVTTKILNQSIKKVF